MWNVLEDFYKDVEGGLDKEFLFDRQQKLNAEFICTEENIDKLMRLDQHICKLEYELYQKFIGIKENLNSLVAQGFDIFKEYQVTGKIDNGVMYIDDGDEPDNFSSDVIFYFQKK